jgi:hypothetical protein
LRGQEVVSAADNKPATPKPPVPKAN